jgi:hypothetical protein
MIRTLPMLIALVVVPTVRAELVSFEIIKREPFANGKKFGATGAYEKLIAIAKFTLDPTNTRNRVIVDLEHAPRNRDGKVEFETDVYILAPKDLAKGNGAILYDVNNRGNKLAIGMFNSGGGGNEPGEGNGFLFRRGYTIVWSGWSGEVLPGNGRLLIHPPIAFEDGKPIRGITRFDMVSDTVTDSRPLSHRDGHGSYSPTEHGEKTGSLTWRMRETDQRVTIPREQWSLIRVPVPKVEQGVQSVLGQVRLKLVNGFRPGYIYELICEVEGPIVQGVGFAGVRDLIAFLKYDTSKDNPLAVEGKARINRAHGFGVSQSGRFLRHFLYQGFNVDENGKKAFDGLMPHVAGGGLGFFNHRFAQPTRHNAQHEEHLFPGDVFPFTYGDSEDPYSKRIDGILHRLAVEDSKLLPKVMHTQSAAEYWHRSGSLVHTDPLGKKDADIPENVRIYAFGGTQHGPASDPPGRGNADNLLNPGDYKPQLRALLDALDAWVREGKEPPPSVYPRIDNGTLVAWNQKDTGFPSLPGIRYPEVIQQPDARNYGPAFLTKGIITNEPPVKIGPYFVRVPRSNSDGNDTGCLLPAEVGMPLATYTGWNLRRHDIGAEGMLASLAGSYIPFAFSAEERKSKGDSRPSIEERYRNFPRFEVLFLGYCRSLVREGYLLDEDSDRLMKDLERRWKAAMGKK